MSTKLQKHMIAASSQYHLEKEYWVNKLSDAEPCEFSYDRVNKNIPEIALDYIEFVYPEQTSLKLDNISNASYKNMLYILSASVVVLLHKYTGKNDLITATPIYKQENDSDSEFINTILPLRSSFDESISFRELLVNMKNTVLEAVKYQNYPIEVLANELGASNDLYFQTVVLLENLQDMQYIQGVNANMIFAFTKTADNLKCRLYYNTLLYKENTVVQIAEHMTNLINTILSDINMKICDINILTEKEQQKLLVEFNDTYADYPRDKTIHELFEAQVMRTPDKAAVVCEEKQLTYSELNEKANRLAHLLREKGITGDSIVGLWTERSLEMIIGILGILKAGGAYLPIDPDYPQDRIEYMLEDSGAKLLLTQHLLSEKMVFGQEIILLDDERLYAGDVKNPEKINQPHDLAYIIYTSGSTGKPKGVMIEHRALMNRINWMQKKYPISGQDVILQKTAYTFDVSVWELLWWSQAGAALCLLAPGGEKDPSQIVRAIEKNRITVMHFVPSMLNVFMEYIEINGVEELSSIRQVFASGEALMPYQVEKFNAILSNRYGTALANLYGPTEAAIDVSYFDCIGSGQLEKVPIGKPIDNIHLYILGEGKRVQPVGVPGELHIAGVGLARGYLNNTQLSAERFVDNPFEPGTKMYRTGDLARWLNDGNIEFLGRIDNQVKIRGYRIELGEIENQLLSYQAVKEAIVTAKDDNSGSKYLCAYIAGERDLTVAELRQHLGKELPDYMIPSYFMQLEKLPLTVSGKIDRKALPEPDGSMASGTVYEAPNNKIEEMLVSIWQEILKADKIGVRDNFFALGGHSIKATGMLARIQKEFNVEIPLREVFEKPIIRSIAEYIKDAGSLIYTAIEPVESKEYYPVSAAQKRMYILNQLDALSTAYNISLAQVIDGELDKGRIEETIKMLIERHEALRTSFEMADKDIVQKVRESVDFKVTYIDGEETDKIIDDFIQPFNLDKAPLLRVGILKVSYKKHIIIYDLHHIICDGTSIAILADEFARLYNGEKLPEQKLQYKDFANWYNNFLESQAIEKQEKYWLTRFSGEIPLLNMPLDYKRPEIQTFNGESYKFNISNEIKEKAEVYAQKSNATLNMFLLSAYSLLLRAYCGQNDMVIGTIAEGRVHSDAEKIVGMFANFLPIRMKINPNNNFNEFIEYTKGITIEAYENQSYPFEELISKVPGSIDRSRNPLFDTMLIYHNELNNNATYDESGLNFYNYDIDRETSTLDFKMDIYPSDSYGLECAIEYNTGLFREETIKALAEQFSRLIEILPHDSGIKISDLKILTGEEKSELEARRINNKNHDKAGIPIAISSTFTSEPVKGYITWWCKQFGEQVNIDFAPYNQVFQQLLDPISLISTNTGANLILVRFEDWIRDDRSDVNTRIEKLERNFSELSEIIKDKEKAIPYFIGIFPISDHLSLESEIIDYLRDMNNRWKKQLENMKNVYIMDFTQIQSLYDIHESFNLQTDKEGHMPFSAEFYAAMGTSIARRICAWRNPAFKVIVLDCDDTLWKGICGEAGSLGVTIGDEYRAFQEFLIKKREEGMLLSICSKNNEPDVWEVFEKNKQMLLKKEHFAAWQINWQLKSENIKKIAEELNLGLDSIVFLDDSAMECSEVMTNCPEVLTLQIPEDSTQIPAFIDHIWALDRLKVTDEDRKRSDMYASERKRQVAQKEVPTLEDFLGGLELKMSMNPVKASQLERVAQLTQRTNQFNISTIRYTEKEIGELVKTPGMACYVIEATDRFGDYGLVGAVITRENEDNIFVQSMMISCRVLGRGIEDAILSGLGKYCKEKCKKSLYTEFYPTAKNKPAYDFLIRTGWGKGAETEEHICFSIAVDKLPDSIKHIQCYYNSSYVKEETNQYIDSKEISGKSTLVVENREKMNWKVNKTNEKNLLHGNHLLPVMHYSAEMLLRLPVYEEENTKLFKSEYIAPCSQTEKNLADIWQLILGVERIGVDDNFFELGGHSLKAMIMISRIQKEMNAEISLKEVFAKPTIRRMAEYIKEAGSIFKAIEPVPKKEYYSVSAAQKRMYILNQLNRDGLTYNITLSLLIEGKLDKGLFEAAFLKLAERHETLRTSFEMIDGEPVQRIHEKAELHIEYLEEEEEKAVKKLREFIKPFDLSKAPLLRVALIKTKEDRHIMLYDMHHIISDGFAMNIIIKEFAKIYEGTELPKLRIQYKDYSEWERRLKEKGVIEKQIEYWKEEFKNEIPVLNLPTDYTRPSVQSFEGDNVSFEAEEEIKLRISQLAHDTGTTVYMVLLAAFNTLLMKYTGQEDIIVGSPIAGRGHADLENIIGMFVNMLAMRNQPVGNKTFKEFLYEVKEKTIKAYENQDIQFEELVALLNIQRDISRNPLFDVVFVFNNSTDDNAELEGIKIRTFEANNRISKFDIMTSAFEGEDKIYFTIEFCTKLFKKETIEAMSVHFLKLLDELLKNPDRKMSEIDILTSEEKSRILFSFNDTYADYPREKLIHQLFEEQVERTPDAVAVICGDKHLTYKHFNEKANQLARVLIRKGIKKDGIVGIMAEHSLEAVIGIMGILKAGGAYLPIDPEYPEDRIRYMLEDSGAGILLTLSSLKREIDTNICTICIDDEEIYTGESANPELINIPEDLAYVIYTSGSTGTPKGVLVNHLGLANYICWADKVYIHGEKLDFPLYSSLCFDLTVTSIFTPLISGNKIIVYGGGNREFVIKRIIEEDKVGIIKLTPTHLQLIREFGVMASNIKKLIVGGEDLKVLTANEIYKLFNDIEIYNEYGPTEATVGCMIYKYDPELDLRISVPIGVPAQNVQIYLLDQYLKPVPVNVSGEIYISGNGVARGYMNRAELTEKSFISNPFIPGRKMYKTGDKARLLHDGNIEYIGRSDNQAKINGFRIETGEIEAQILKLKSISDVVVDIRENKKDYNMKEIVYCSRCGLPSNYPNTTYDKDMVCNMCRDYSEYKEKADSYFKNMIELEEMFEAHKANNGSDYDCIVLFSGGKDSSYVLYKLVDMGVKVLALTLDNGYISETALNNIGNIIEELKIDNIIIKPETMKQIFYESLVAESNVCNGCFKALLALSTKMAYEKGIKYVVTGLSRGQIYEMRLTSLFSSKMFDPQEVDKAVLEARKVYHGMDDYISRLLDVKLLKDETVFDKVTFIDFYRYTDVKKAEIFDFLKSRSSIWSKPSDTGFCSSNCRINDVGIYVHCREQGYHNYALPTCWEVRTNHLTLDVGKKELSGDVNIEQVKTILNEIGYGENCIRDRDFSKYLAAYYVSDKNLTVSELRSHLKKELPDYMVPSYFVQMEKLPLTPNGKLDRKALPEPHGSISSEATYEAPTNEIEEILVKIWQEVLGVKQVGTKDNFFVMGGDSIKVIQASTRLLKYGMAIEHKDIFKYQTISALAPFVKKNNKEAYQGVVEGQVMLTPVQRWYFENYSTDKNHFNHAVMLFRRNGFNEAILHKVLEKLLEHHDALRMVFREADGELIQYNMGMYEKLLEIRVVEIPDSKGYKEQIQAEAEKTQQSIDLQNGPLLKAVLFKTSQGDHLQIVIHHLIVDGVSWRIILEDLAAAYGQAEKNEEIELPDKTDSYKLWAEKLYEYAKGKKLLREMEYWKQIDTAEVKLLPKDYTHDNICHDADESIVITFAKEETHALLNSVNKAYNTEINDILLTALGMAISDWTNKSSVAVWLEGHGREEIIKEVDIKRTVGWFTSIYPFVLDMSKKEDIGYQIKTIKEKLRKIPEKGIGYGIIRYMADKTVAGENVLKLTPQIIFNYLGQFDTDLYTGSFGQSEISPGTAIGKNNKRLYAVDISGMVTNGKLSMSFEYSRKEYEKVTIQKIADNYKSRLQRIITVCTELREPEATPSDLGSKTLSLEGLNKINALLKSKSK